MKVTMKDKAFSSFLTYLFLCVISFTSSLTYGQSLDKKSIYQLNSRLDFSLVAIGGLAYGGGHLIGFNFNPTTNDHIELSKQSLWAIDRGAVSNWSPEVAELSDFTSYGGIALFGIGSAIIGKGKGENWKVGLLFGEAIVLNAGLTELAKNVFRRPRPYLYGTYLSIAEKDDMGKEGWRSFWSGHTSNTMCAAVFFSTVFSDLYPDSKFRLPVWIGAVGLAAYTGVLRYQAGKHFPTDIIAGGIIGSVLGYAIPRIHRTKGNTMSYYPVIQGNGALGLGMQIQF